MSNLLELVMPGRLKSANAHARRHWTYWHRETHLWEALINVALCHVPDGRAWSVVDRIEMELDERGHLQPVEIRRIERRRVSVIRVVANKRHFCTDDDNLKFSLKPLLDALKRVALITDDKREWLEQPALPEQQVAEDRIAKTIVRIERISQEEGTWRVKLTKSHGTGRSGATRRRLAHARPCRARFRRLRA